MRFAALPRHLLGFGVAAALLGAAQDPPTARALDFWLMPSTYQAGLADTASVTAWSGAGFRGQAERWHRPRVNTFRLVGYRDVNLAGTCADGDSIWARFLPVDEEGEMVFVETNWAVHARTTAGLQAEARRLGPRNSPPPATDAGPLRVRERVCAKAWLPGATGRRFAQTLGGDIELTPLTDPAASGPLRLRLECAGRPLAEAVVEARVQPLRTAALPAWPARRDSAAVLAEARTNAAGEVTLELKGRGEFLVSAGTMRARADSVFVGAEILRATLTFARP